MKRLEKAKSKQLQHLGLSETECNTLLSQTNQLLQTFVLATQYKNECVCHFGNAQFSLIRDTWKACICTSSALFAFESQIVEGLGVLTLEEYKRSHAIFRHMLQRILRAQAESTLARKCTNE